MVNKEANKSIKNFFSKDKRFVVILEKLTL